MEFKDRLENIRRERNLKQTEVAEAMEVSASKYRRWEDGRGEPSLSELKRLASFLGVSVSELMGEETGPASDRVTLHYGPLSLDIPTTSEGLTFLERMLSEGKIPGAILESRGKNRVRKGER